MQNRFLNALLSDLTANDTFHPYERFNKFRSFMGLERSG
jgi:hypothetical protein